jgi:hypothetical protein
VSILATLLEIAIVLAAIYVSLSCLCSAINEQVAAFLQLRGKTLYDGVLNLVVGEAKIADAVFAHPLIAAASNDPDGKPDPAKSYRPSYLDARNFSMALWQSVQQQAQQGTAGAAAAAAVNAPAQLMTDLQASVDGLRNAQLKSSLSALIAAAGNDYRQLLAATDGWFNAQMDRVSGWYKRQTQWILAVIAVIVVLVSGIDSVEIAKVLYYDQGLRQTAVDAIAKAVPTPAPNATPAPGAVPNMAPVARAIDQQMTAELGGFFHPPQDWVLHLWHLPGMVLTFVALQLGAPFWFDALCSLVNVRNAGRKPQRDDQPPQ